MASDAPDPLENVLDCFVSTSSGCGVSVIERSICAHRLLLGDDADAIAADVVSKLSTLAAHSDSSVQSPLNGTDMKYGRVGFEITRQYAGQVERRVAKMKVAAKHGLISPRSRILTTRPSAPATSVLAPSWRYTLTQSEVREADTMDVDDALTQLTDDAVLSITMQNTADTRPTLSTSFGSFVYVVARVIVRTCFLQWTRQDIETYCERKKSELDDDTATCGCVFLLLRLAERVATELFMTADVDHTWSVRWSALTTALVDCGAARHALVQLSIDDVDKKAVKETPELLLHRKSRRICQYDRYESAEFPKGHVTRAFPGAMTWVANSPFVVLEGRSEQSALVHSDNFNAVKHYLPRHRADTTKLGPSSIVSAALLDTSLSALIVAEVDMHIYCYDFGPKRRLHLAPTIVIRSPCAITSSCLLPSSGVLVVGNRVGALHVIEITRKMADATRATEAVGALDSHKAEWTKSIEDIAYQCIGLAHSDAVTAIAETSLSLVLSAGFDGSVCVWSVPTWTRVRSFTAHVSGIKALIATRSHERFVTHSFDGSTTIWHTAHGVNSNALDDPLVPHMHRVEWLVLDDAVHELLTVDVSGLVKVWDLLRCTVVTTYFALSAAPQYLETLGQVDDKEGSVTIGRFHEISADMAPVQSCAFDARRHALYVRGHRNEFCAVLVDGAKVLRAHDTGVKAVHVLPLSGTAITSCSQAVALWSCSQSLDLVHELRADAQVSPGDAPAALPHLSGSHNDGGARQTRSDVLHAAIGERSTAGKHLEDATLMTGLTPTQAHASAALRDVCSVCISALNDYIFVALSDGSILCHKASSGRCIKIFTAQRITSSASTVPAQGTATLASRSPRRKSEVSSVKFALGPPSGYSLDAVSCCFIDTERTLAVTYADGAIRYFSDDGTSRTATRHQVAALADAGATSGGDPKPQSPPVKLATATRAMSVMLQLNKETDVLAQLRSPRQPPRPSVTAFSRDGSDASDSLMAAKPSPDTVLLSASSGVARLVATCHIQGRVRLLDLESNSPVVKVVDELIVEGEVTAVAFGDPLPCLLVGTTQRVVEVFPVRGSSVLTLVHDAAADIVAAEQRKRRTRAMSTFGGTIGSRTLSTSTRKKSISAAPASGGTSGGGEVQRSIARVAVAHRPSSVQLHPTIVGMLIVGLSDGRVHILDARHVLVALDLGAPLQSLAASHDTLSRNRKWNRETGRLEFLQKLCGALHRRVSVAETPSKNDQLGTPTHDQLELSDIASGPPAVNYTGLLCYAAVLNMFGQDLEASISAAQRLGGFGQSHDQTVLIDATAELLTKVSATIRLQQTSQRGVHAISMNCIAPLRRRLPLGLTALHSEAPSMELVPSSSVTSIACLPGGFILVGTHNGNVQLHALGIDGALAILNRSSSLVDSFASLETEWLRRSMIRQNVQARRDAREASNASNGTSTVADGKGVTIDCEGICAAEDEIRSSQGRVKNLQVALRVLTTKALEELRGMENRVEEYWPLGQTIATHASEVLTNLLDQAGTERRSVSNEPPTPSIVLDASPQRVAHRTRSDSLIAAQGNKSPLRASSGLSPLMMTLPSPKVQALEANTRSLRQCMPQRSPRAPSLVVIEDSGLPGNGAAAALTGFSLAPSSHPPFQFTVDSSESWANDLEDSMDTVTGQPKQSKERLRVPIKSNHSLEEKCKSQTAEEDWPVTWLSSAERTSQQRAPARPAGSSRPLSSPRHPRVPIDVHLRYGVGSRGARAPTDAKVDYGRDMARLDHSSHRQHRLSDRVGLLRREVPVTSSSPQGRMIGFGLFLPV